jgi:hypothetical protein
MLSAAATIVKNAVDEMAKALNDMMDWVVDYITNLVQSSLSSIKNDILKSRESYSIGVGTSSQNCVSEYSSTGTVSTAKIEMYRASLLNEFFNYLYILASVILIIVGVVYFFTNVWGFLLGTLIGIVGGYVIDQMLGGNSLFQQETESDGSYPNHVGIAAFAEAFGLGPDANDHSEAAENWRLLETGIGAILDWHAALAGIIALEMTKDPTTLCKWGFVLAFVSLAIGTSNYVADCASIGWISLSLGLISLGMGIVDFIFSKVKTLMITDLISMLMDFSSLVVAIDLIEFPEV